MKLPRTPRWLAVLGGIALTGGLAAAGYAIGAGNKSATTGTAASNAYGESGQCGACPAGTRLDSVELQSRTGSLLFVLRGSWPGSVDQLKVSVCLNSADTSIRLKPHGSGNAFEPTVLTGSTSATTSQQAQAIAGGIQGNALLIDLQPPLQPPVPVTFDVSLCNGASTLQRLPSAGELLWHGSGPPVRIAAPSTPTPAPTPTPIIGPDPTSLIDSCSAIPSATVPPYLQMSGSTSGMGRDPRTGATTEQVKASLAASPVGVTSPFAVEALVLPQGASPPQGQQRFTERGGTEELFAFHDTALHKSLRLFQGGAWTTMVDSAAGAMTIVLDASPAGVTFYWSGLHAGDHYGFITASSSGCASLGLSASFAPQLVAGS